MPTPYEDSLQADAQRLSRLLGGGAPQAQPDMAALAQALTSDGSPTPRAIVDALRGREALGEAGMAGGEWIRSAAAPVVQGARQRLGEKNALESAILKRSLLSKQAGSPENEPAPADWGALPGMTKGQAIRAGFGRAEKVQKENEMLADASEIKELQEANFPIWSGMTKGDYRKAKSELWQAQNREKEARIAAGARREGEEKKDASDLLDREERLRKEWTGSQTYKDAQAISTTYKKIITASDTGPGDISLIFAYMKMIDPSSTVREGEFATAEQAGGIPGKLLNLYNKAVEGDRLTPQTREQFKREAKALRDATYAQYKQQGDKFRALAKKKGVDPDAVVFSLDDDQPAAGAAAPGAPTTVAQPPQRKTIGSDTYEKRGSQWFKVTP